MRIFLDANILFSCAKSDGAVRRLLALLAKAGHECWADGYVAEEARRNLAAKAPDGLPELKALLSRMNLAAVQSSSVPPAFMLALPEKDRPVLAAAIRLGCEALVTGDSTHFGPLFGKTFDGVTVYSPRLLAQMLLR
jgi:predicted nucleic acid-binding protein